MRSNIDIFTLAIAPHTTRLVTGFDSALNTGSCSIGLIQGQYRSLNAIVTESVSDLDQWHIVNLKGGTKEKPEFDSIAVLGVVDHQQASDLSLLHFGRMFDAAVVDVSETSQHGLMRHLSTAHYHKSKNMIAAWQLEKLQDVTSAVIPQWDDINLNSHQGSTAHLLLDMQRHDDYGELLEKSDRLPALLASLNAVQSEFDSIIVEQQYLDHLMSLLHTAMETASSGGVKVTQTQGSKPFEVSEVFRHKKVLNIAVSYDFDDGQSIAIVFHNPDRDAKKISPQDTLISWKIMMNKRDITAAIQPNQGEGITMPILAGRIMKLINQNSARFKRTQAKKAENAQALTDTVQRIEQKQLQSEALDTEISDLLNQIDALVPTSHAATEPNLSLNEYGYKVYDKIVENGDIGKLSIKDSAIRSKAIEDAIAILEQGNIQHKYDFELVIKKVYEIWGAEQKKKEAALSLEQYNVIKKGLQPYLDKIVSLLNLTSQSVGNSAFSKSVVVGNIAVTLFANPLNSKLEIGLSVHQQDSIDEHMGIKDFSLEELQNGAMEEAEQFALSLDKKFKELTGTSITDQATEDKKRDKVLFALSFAGIVRVLNEKFGWLYSFNVNGLEKTFASVHVDTENNSKVTIIVVQDENMISVKNGDEVIVSDLIPQYGAIAQSEENYTQIAQKLNNAAEKWVLEHQSKSKDINQISQNKPNQADLDYLNAIIAGQIGFEDAEAVEQQLEEIAERLTPETEPLFEQAVNMYSDYQVNQAATI